MFRWRADSRGSWRHLATPETPGYCGLRHLVPQRTFRHHAHDLLGILEQYARKHYDPFHCHSCLFLHGQSAKSQSIIILVVWDIVWTKHILCGFGKRSRRHISTLALAFGLMFSMSTASAHFFKRYWRQQVLASVTGERETSGSHFNILKVVSRENLVPLLAAGMLTAAMYRLRQSTISAIHYRLFWYYLGIALAGSLPILISAKQKRWYAFPSLPFYSLAIAVVFNDVALALERFIGDNKRRYKYITLFSSMILCIAVFLMFLEKNTLRRDKDFHRDFSEQSLIIAERSIISVYPPSLATNWSLVANIQRKFKASLSETIGHDYLLTTTEYLNSEHIPPKYKRIPPFYAKKYILFRLAD